VTDAPRKRGRPRKHPLPEAQSYDAALVEFVQATAPSPEAPARVVTIPADVGGPELDAAITALSIVLDDLIPEPRPTGRVRWKGSSGAHPRTALQVAWQCAGGIEWRHIEVVGPDAPDTEDAP
jgi:hypothetical protein